MSAAPDKKASTALKKLINENPSWSQSAYAEKTGLSASHCGRVRKNMGYVRLASGEYVKQLKKPPLAGWGWNTTAGHGGAG